MNILQQAGFERYLALSGTPAPDGPVGRITAEFGTAYTVLTSQGEAEAIALKTLLSERSAAERPKTGDWVTLEQVGTERKYRIRSILPRTSELARKRTGKRMEAQVLAVNVDIALVAESANAELDLDRIERFLTVPTMARIPGHIALTKCDLVSAEELAGIRSQLLERFPQTPVHYTSTETLQGIPEIGAVLAKGLTAVIIGPSGVGKSSLINALRGSSDLKTQTVRLGDQKGRHTTTVRELLLLPEGGVIIDTPGMRELQLWGDATTELDATFADIEQLALACRFSDCDHDQSAGCAIQDAIRSGTLDPKRLLSFQKLKRELEHQASKHSYETALGKRKREKMLTKQLRTIVRHKRGKR